MACCLVYWGNNIQKFFNNFIEYGAVVDISNLKKQKIGEETLYDKSLFEEDFILIPSSQVI